MTTKLRKQDFAARLSPETLGQLDMLVKGGKFQNRTEAIEVAVNRLFDAERRDPDRLRRAFERACGAISGGIDREAWRRAEADRLEWEAARNAGRR
ncbi:MAG: hypothetical protein HY332_14980 [Chloroflexi bacterium]|nr:hypothetical protein [Chloroflexota bacterium]